MNKVAKILAVSGVLAFASASFVNNASAQDWHNRDSGNAVAAGIAGLAAGVIAGAIIASPPPSDARVYVTHDDDERDDDNWNGNWRNNDWRDGDWRDRDRYAFRQIRPWTRDWYRWCEDQYNSFDPQSGTFIDRYGRERFCVVR